MMNRRQVLQSLFSFTAGCAVVHCQTAITGLSAQTPQADNSSGTLIELLQNTIQLCNNGRHVGLAADQREAVETQELCQQAITRVQRSSRNTPAFWQACSDSVSRLEAAVSAYMEASRVETQSSSNSLRRLRSLKKQLAIQTIQAIRMTSRLV